MRGQVREAVHARHRGNRMLTLGWWLAIAVIGGAGLVAGFRVLSKRSYVKDRTPSSLEDLHALVKDRVSFEVFREVWAVLGAAYGLDPRLIRPTDTFAELNKADSWTLGKGEDELTAWVDRRGLGRPPQLKTVLDLAAWVEKSAPARAPG